MEAKVEPGFQDIEWQPLTLTLVEYPKGKGEGVWVTYYGPVASFVTVFSNSAATHDDWIGKMLAIISLTPFGIGAGFLVLILFRRDLHTIAFFAGSLLNECLNIVLKHLIRETRPLSRGHHYSEYGMPSNHAQNIWFFNIYVLYFVLIRLHHINNNSIISALWRAIIVFGCTVVALLVSVSRIYLQYHTTSQVVVGAIAGFLFATFWFALVHKVFTPVFPQLVSLKVCEMLMIRDTTLIPNVLWFEYTSTRQEARARGRKMAANKPAQ